MTIKRVIKRGEEVVVINDRGDTFVYGPFAGLMILRSHEWNGDQPSNHADYLLEAQDEVRNKREDAQD